MKLLALAATAILAACAAPRVTGSGARVHAGPSTALITEMITEVEPVIIWLLGTRWDREYRVELVDEPIPWGVADTRDLDRRVRLEASYKGEKELRFSLAHELTHVHMLGKWRELPPVLQEGVAYWVSLVATGRTGEFISAPPSQRLCLDMMTMSYGEYKRLEQGRQNEIEATATWVARSMFDSAEVKPGSRIRVQVPRGPGPPAPLPGSAQELVEQ